MHVHILGICGTFMGGIAALARAAGHRVTGSDRNVYPPMSTQLAALGIELQLDAERRELRAHRRIDIAVRARDPVPGRAGERGNSAHESSTDTEDVYVHNHADCTLVPVHALRAKLVRTDR